MSNYTDLVAAWSSHLPDANQNPARILVVAADGSPQMLGLLDGGNLAAEYPISTARKGLGEANGSDETPVGWHQTPGAMFEKKAPTGGVWQEGGPTVPALMLTRLLVLEGLEPGLNLGGDVDTFNRGIYIHGTNCTAELGTPASHGCVRMDYQKVVELFDQVSVGDLVLIAGGDPE